MIKYLFLMLFVLFFLGLMFPRLIPWFLHKLGFTLGQARRTGEELLTGEEVENSPLARYEARAGEVLAMRVLTEHPAVDDAALQSHVREVGEKLAAHAQRKEIPYSFTVIHHDDPNAFAVAGGAVFITQPLLDLCEDDAVLAGVLGHEIIHIDRRHALRNLAASMAVKGGIRLLSFGRGAILSRVVGGMQQLLVQGYRQDQELEADRFGCRLARLAGYRPDGLLRLLELLQRRDPTADGPLAAALAFFKSHPPFDLRTAEIRREL